MTKLQTGGALLPNLIEFYLWLHQDLKGVFSEEEAKRKSLYDVMDEFGDEYHRNLYDQVKGILVEAVRLGLEFFYCVKDLQVQA